MVRHMLLITLTTLLLLPTLVSAQGTEPVGTVSTGNDEAARAYDDPNTYFDAMTSIMAIGTIHPTEAAAERSMRTFPAIFAASIRTDAGTDFNFSDPQEVSVDPIGDGVTAHVIRFTMFGSFQGEYGLLSVRQGTWVQLLIGFGVGEVDIISDVRGIAEDMLDRWPSDAPIAVREDGLRTGGVWSMMPVPEDMREGFVVDPAFEDGPPATVDAVVPVEPRDGEGTPAATEPAATPAATTEAPVEATPVSTEQPVEATPVPTEARVESTPPQEAVEPTQVPDRPEPTEDVSEPQRDLPLLPPLSASPTEVPAATDTEPAGATPIVSEPTVEATEEPAGATPVATTEAPEATPIATEAIADATPAPVEATPVAPDVTPEPTEVPVQETPTPTEVAAETMPTPASMHPRLALEFDLRLEIIVPLASATVAEDGSCAGAGLLDGLTGDATITVRAGGDSAVSVSSPVDGPGIIAYDTLAQQEVCYFSASLADVPPRSTYTVMAGESVLGRYTYEDVTAENSFLIVLGEE